MIKAVDDLDATNICSDNKLIKCVADCKKSHNGPIIDVDGLETLTENLSSDEMTLQKALNLEIRFRKLSLTNVKDPCPLFRQRGLSIDEKKRNLNTLISSHVNFCALPSLQDLEIAITEYDVADEAQRKERTVQHLSNETDMIPDSDDNEEPDDDFEVDELSYCFKMVHILGKFWNQKETKLKQISRYPSLSREKQGLNCGNGHLLMMKM